MRKIRLLFIAAFFCFIVLNSCNNPDYISADENNSINNSDPNNESKDIATDKSKISNEDTTSKEAENSSEKNNEEESKNKITGEETLDDGRNWGPLED